MRRCEVERLKGKVALITGAAAGIGRAISRLFAQEGAKVVATDIDEPRGVELAEEIRKDGGECTFMRLDVSKEEDWERVMGRVLEEFGGLDILVNNAGIMLRRRIEEMTVEEWRRVMSINLDGVFLGTKYAIRAMKGKGGSIVNISSAVGIVGTPDDTSAYIASKGAVRLFTKAAALECSKMGYGYNIRVNSVHPGVIVTSMTESMMEDEELKKKLIERHPIGFLGSPMDVAYAVLYLASEEARFVTGAELVVDGGWTCY